MGLGGLVHMDSSLNKNGPLLEWNPFLMVGGLLKCVFYDQYAKNELLFERADVILAGLT